MCFGSDDPNDPVLFDLDLVSKAAGLRFDYEEDMETFAPHKALDEIFKVIQRANKYIDENAPWALAKDRLVIGHGGRAHAGDASKHRYGVHDVH